MIHQKMTGRTTDLWYEDPFDALLVLWQQVCHGVPVERNNCTKTQVTLRLDSHCKCVYAGTKEEMQCLLRLVELVEDEDIGPWALILLSMNVTGEENLEAAVSTERIEDVIAAAQLMRDGHASFREALSLA